MSTFFPKLLKPTRCWDLFAELLVLTRNLYQRLKRFILVLRGLISIKFRNLEPEICNYEKQFKRTLRTCFGLTGTKNGQASSRFSISASKLRHGAISFEHCFLLRCCLDSSVRAEMDFSSIPSLSACICFFLLRLVVDARLRDFDWNIHPIQYTVSKNPLPIDSFSKYKIKVIPTLYMYTEWPDLC